MHRNLLTLLLTTVLAGSGLRAAETVDLIQLRKPDGGWTFDHGGEFPGAKGTRTAVKDLPAPGSYGLRLSGDFTQGGAYVAAEESLASLNVERVESVRLLLRSANVQSLTLRLIDGSKQCHQKKNFPVVPDGQWHEQVLRPAEIAGGELWLPLPLAAAE